MPILPVTVNEKIATYTGSERYICGNSDFVVELTLDDEWRQQDTKTARFVFGKEYIDVVFTGNTVSVPVIEKAHEIQFGIYAGNLQTTTPAGIPCDMSIRSYNKAPAAPTQTVYDQIIGLINEMIAQADGRYPVDMSIRTIISNGQPDKYILVLKLESGEELTETLPQMGLMPDDVVKFGSGKPSGGVSGGSSNYKQFYINEDTSQLYIRTNKESPGEYIAVGGFLAGNGAPSTTTVASKGNIYLNITTGELHRCTGVVHYPELSGSINVTWEKIAKIPTKTSELENDAGFITKAGWKPDMYLGTDANGNMVEKDAPQGGTVKETDPTVPDWAKQPTKPTYTASEVGALPASMKIPGKTSDLENDSGYITITETYSQTEVDNLISGLDKRLNAIADSEDVDLDQLSEIVAYIKDNKSLIDSITTDKVNVADIVDNLTTADSKKPLSAAQGKALKALYDAIPAWAKAANKPTYSKSEVGLGNVDNVRQYSASNPPPYPVTSVNGQTGAVTVTAEGIGAATTGQVEELSTAIADLKSAGIIVVQDGDTLIIGEVGDDG